MKNHTIWELILLLFFLSTSLSAQPDFSNIPFIPRNYEASEYLGSTQVWAIEDDGDETVFYATASGLSVFDGVRFSNYQPKEFSLFRCLTFDHTTKRLYGAADNQFGYWAKNDLGEYAFTILYKNTKHNKPDIFWQILLNGEYLYLRTETQVLSFNLYTHLMEVIVEGEYINYIGLLDKKLIIQKDSILYTISDSVTVASWQPKNRIVYQELKGGHLISVTEDAVYIDNRFLMGEYHSKIQGKQIFSSVSLNDSTLLLGTVLDGLFVIDLPTGKVLDHYNHKRGLQYTTVLSIHVDSTCNIWLGLDGGLSVIQPESTEQIYKHFGWDIGFVYSFTQYRGNTYIGTNKGLYVLCEDNSLTRINNSQGQVWEVGVYNDVLIVSHDKGIFCLENNKLIKCDVPKFWLLREVGRDNLYLSVDYHGGLSLYKIENHKLEYIRKVNGFDASPTRINKDRYGFLWSIDGLNRPFRLVLNEQYDVSIWENYVLPCSGVLQATLLDNDIVFFCDTTAYTYNVLDNKLEKNPYYTAMLRTCSVIPEYLVQMGNWFIYGTESFIGYSERKENAFINRGEILSHINLATAPPFARKIHSISTTLIGLGISNGIAFFDVNKIKKENPKQLVLEKIELHCRNKIQMLPANSFEVSIPHSYLSLNIYVSHLINKNIYYRINGDKWKIVPADPFFELPYLTYGEYLVELTNNPKDDTTLIFNVKVATPWYLTIYFKLLASVGISVFLLLIYFLVKFRIKRREKIMIKEQQEIFAKEKRNLEMLLLKQRIKEDQKTLVNLTMNGIQRNTILLDLKKDINELRKAEALLVPQKVGILLKKVEYHLNSQEDWILFEKYFNTIHDGFSTRLSNVHPNLTSNEKKLCILLKLNMSTKDISGFLNISANSVDVARHRLRKKIELAPEESLQFYISQL